MSAANTEKEGAFEKFDLMGDADPTTELRGVLEIDEKHRRWGATGDVRELDLSALDPGIKLGDPYRVYRSNRELPASPLQSIKTVRGVIRWLNNSQRWDNTRGTFVVAGAGLGQTLIGLIPDVLDFFYVGMEDAAQKQEIVRNVQVKAASWGVAIAVRRTIEYIEVVLPTVTLRYHLQHFSSISELLHSRELGFEAVAFDGMKLMTTTLGAYAYRRRLNILRREKTADPEQYLEHVVKYAHWGFGFVATQGVDSPSYEATKLRADGTILANLGVTPISQQFAENDSEELIKTGKPTIVVSDVFNLYYALRRQPNKIVYWASNPYVTNFADLQFKVRDVLLALEVLYTSSKSLLSVILGKKLADGLDALTDMQRGQAFQKIAALALHLLVLPPPRAAAKLLR